MGGIEVIPASVVIPVCNEADTIADTIRSIKQQAILPAELIVIDAGSNDDTLGIIKREWKNNQLDISECVLVIEVVPGAYPGEGRNRGIKISKMEWVIFLDAGIYPEEDWLKKLWQCQEDSHENAIFGQCDFDSDHPIGKAVCAVSYGIGKVISTIPGSIINKKIFNKIGYFREDLRSAEDLEWRDRFSNIYDDFTVCKQTVLHYRDMPVNFLAIYIKWHRNSVNTVLSGIMRMQIVLYLVVSMLFLVLVIIKPLIALIMMLFYFLIRGLVDPVRRSGRSKWWKTSSSSLLIAPFVTLTIDISKSTGFAYGIYKNIKLKRIL